MKLENATPYPAYLFRTVIDERRMFGSLGARVTYDIVDGQLRPAADQWWKVMPRPWENDYGPMPSDELLYRGGVDVLVLGSARAPKGRPTTRVDVEARIGPTWRGRVTVLGDRVWREGRDGPVAGPPAAFTEIPLTLKHAFGGKDEWDGLDVPFTDNPDGRGFFLEEERALGQLLPNIVDPAQPIQRWDERPEPVGTQIVPQGFGPQLRRSVVFDEQTGMLKEVRPTFYNNAFPQMIAPAAKPGDRVSVTGVAEAGPVAFQLPPCDLLVRIGIGAHHYEFEPAIEQIGVEPDRMRAFVSYRYPFRYTLVPLEKRYCELVTRAR